LLALVLATWARSSPSGALGALADLDAQTAVVAGVALLGVIGNDERGVARVLDAAPQIDADRLRAEAAVANADLDPEAALAAVLRLPARERSAALPRIAAAWVKRDVFGLLAYVDLVTDERLRDELRRAAWREWALLDTEAALEHVAELDVDDQREALDAGLQAFVLVDPQRALAAAQTWAGEAARLLRRSALMSLAQDDALAALRHVEAMPDGDERAQLLGLVAGSYARADPEAALTWAHALAPASPLAVARALAELARVDPQRTLDLVMEMPAPLQRRTFELLARSNTLDGEHMTQLADRLLAASDRSQALQMFTRLWAQREPEAALSWSLANVANAPRALLAQAGTRLAHTDPRAAIAYLERVPAERRADWLTAVAGGYAQLDARAAAGWVAGHRGEAGYDAAVAAVAARTADTDPVAAAELLGAIDWSRAPDAPAAARGVAARWAERDPSAAARWAAALGDDGARTLATAAVASQWAAGDAAGARTWALELPAGAVRDAALVEVLGATTEGAALDQRLLDAFSAADARERGVGATVRIVAQRDLAAARLIVERYLTDAGARRAAERFIAGPAPAP
jgi:hypothetical protein